jgi:hypothetical protein
MMSVRLGEWHTLRALVTLGRASKHGDGDDSSTDRLT